MNIAVIERWVAALRSGEYSQTKRSLRNERGFCCLGVLCDTVKDDMDFDWFLRNGEWTFDGRSGYVPESVANYINIYVGALDRYATMNDKQGMDFQEIAAQIEEDLLTSATDESKVTP